MMLITMTMMACRTMVPSQSSSQHDSIVHHSVFNVHHSAIKDTIAVLDSVSVYERSDTVYINHLRTEWRERIISKTDTVMLTDTVRIELRDTLHIPAEPSRIGNEKARMSSWCKWLLWANVVLVLYWIGKRMLRLYFVRL